MANLKFDIDLDNAAFMHRMDEIADAVHEADSMLSKLGLDLDTATVSEKLETVRDVIYPECRNSMILLSIKSNCNGRLTDTQRDSNKSRQRLILASTASATGHTLHGMIVVYRSRRS